jgi:hypothetical protein
LATKRPNSTANDVRAGQLTSVALADLIKLSRGLVGIEARTVRKAPRVVA